LDRWETQEQQGLGHIGLKKGLLSCSLTPLQLEELRQQLEQQEEELGRLRLGVVRLLGQAREQAEGLMEFQVDPEEIPLSVRGRRIQRKEFSISRWRTRP
jgi:hypothetical protein